MNDVAKSPARQPVGLHLFDTAPMNWLRGEIDRLFDDFGQPPRSLFSFGARSPVPALEFSDTGRAYRLTVELPGMREDGIKIEVASGVLGISGEKAESKDQEENGCLVSERRYGAFNRKLTLPEDADPDAIDATFENGLLTVTIGKDQKASSKARTIPIKG